MMIPINLAATHVAGPDGAEIARLFVLMEDGRIFCFEQKPGMEEWFELKGPWPTVTRGGITQ